MLNENLRELAHKISLDTARMVSEYFEAKVKRTQKTLAKQGVDPGIAAGYAYMAMLGGTIGTVTSVIEAVSKNNPDLGAKLREDIIEKVGKAGTQ